MNNKLLTAVIISLVNRKARAHDYGVAIINLPHFDYAGLVQSLDCDKSVEVFFLGFDFRTEEQLKKQLPALPSITYSYTVEEAEASRNTGNESIFRILIIKRAEIEKLSSLRWFPEITLEMVYAESCSYTRSNLSQTNSVIDALIQALRRKAVRSILNFERVLDYLELLLNSDERLLPEAVVGGYYKLGLCSDRTLSAGNPSADTFVQKIRQNHSVVERLGNLEQAERQSITNYYSDVENDKTTPRLILQFYKTKDIALLQSMDIEDVEKCLKAARKKKSTPARSRAEYANPTSLAAQLVFDDNSQQIESVLDQINQQVDGRANPQKSERVEINHEGTKIQIKTEPATEVIAEELVSENDFGGIIFANVLSPSEAICDIDKYAYTPFRADYLDEVWSSLSKIGKLVPDGESITKALKAFLQTREAIVPYRIRLQDAPMLQVLAKKDAFSAYLHAYERLLYAINDDFPKIWKIAPSNAKEIINVVMALDNLFIIGNEVCHAVPTPLNPLYLWKYIQLAEEILSGNEVNGIEDGRLSEDDKAFIIRKAEDIPDPLAVMLLPVTIRPNGAVFLPLTGRVGMLPIYSTNQQINQSESGVDYLKQAVTRYLCLYPHAGMMLRISIIDPPSVETVIAMLKMLNSDREFNISGIEVSLYRTKAAASNWIEIEDESLNNGMLGKVKGRRSLNFKLRIHDKPLPYQKIITEIADEQHLLVLFDPNEVKIETAQNNKRIHIHPLCVPKIYQYNPVDEKVEIRPANEGGIFSVYASILEKLNEHPSTFSHTSTFFNTPLKRDTYDLLLQKADWLIILDQSLKSWDVSLRAASEKLFYRENDYRSMGIYSQNSKKFVMGYDYLIKQCGNYIPSTTGVEKIIEAVREINDDGLLSIVSHSSNKIFDDKHGKGSLGLAASAIHYKKRYPDAMLVGLDTQLAREWLSDRDDNKLPDLVGIRFTSHDEASIDVIEVKTYSDNQGSFSIAGTEITGHAVEQATVLEALIREIFGASEKITTVSRKEILREQVFESLFQASMDAAKKHRLSEQLNALFAGEIKVEVNKSISFVDFEHSESSEKQYDGVDAYVGNKYCLITIGSDEIQSIIGDSFPSLPTLNDEPDKSPSSEPSVADAEAEEMQAPDLCADTSRSEQTRDGRVKKATSQSQPKLLTPTFEAEANTKEDAEASDRKRSIDEKCSRLNKVFRDYGIQAYPVNPDLVQEAARFTRFSVELKSGESKRSIERYKDDIGIQLEANGEILIDHIRGTKFISVDVPFVGAASTISLINNLSRLDASSGQMDVLAGQRPDGGFEIVDISKAPHMLIAGTTGSGKTIFLYSIIVSLLHKYSAENLEFLIIDPKQTDFVFFEDLPNLYGGHIVVDADEALEMIHQINDVDKEDRMRLIRSSRSRDISSYNEKNPTSPMKRLVIIIDEYADLIQTAEMQGNRKDFERFLSMLAQKVRSLGIHLIIATQRPSANIVTGVLKANIPYRVSFRLPSHTDSQTILDMSGAENLLGKGDMLFVTDSDTKRMQGLFITEDELTEFMSRC